MYNFCSLLEAGLSLVDDFLLWADVLITGDLPTFAGDYDSRHIFVDDEPLLQFSFSTI